MIYYTKFSLPAAPKEKSRQERQISRALFRFVLSRRLPFCGNEPLEQLLVRGEHGKPFLKGNPFYFNLSHSGGLVLCAAEDVPVGVDVEKRRSFSEKLMERICTPGERALAESGGDRDRALTQLWTMKESYMKYTGKGFAQGILSTEFSSLGDRPALRSGDAFFVSRELSGAFLTLCTGEPVELFLEQVSSKELSPFLEDRR